MKTTMTRRNFVTGVGATAVATMGALTPVTAMASDTTFDAEYDVVVVGFGLAGASAATYAAQAGSRVLLLDKAPEGREGGNSFYCAQCVTYTQGSVEDAETYYTELGWKMHQDPEVVRAFAEGIKALPETFETVTGTAPVIWSEFIAEHPEEAKAAAMTMLYNWGVPEFPELNGNDGWDSMTIHAGISDTALYMAAHDNVLARENVTFWPESPATHLVRNWDSGEIEGVTVLHNGQELRIRALGGVVLACGGFECNTQMIQDYLGKPRIAAIGGQFNDGDGIRMAQEVGADLWHMSVYESTGFIPGHSLWVPEGEAATNKFYLVGIQTFSGPSFVVGDDGTRYMNELQSDRHGHINVHGIWEVPHFASNPYVIMDAALYASFAESNAAPANIDEITVCAPTPEELAEAIGVDPQKLRTTYDRFNTYAAQGEDWEFGRAPETMAPFGEGNLYAVRLVPSVLNTQGGPRRNAQAQVIDVNGNPIPRLYACGECGGVCTFYYQGASNTAECLSFGRIAGTNASQGIAQ